MPLASVQYISARKKHCNTSFSLELLQIKTTPILREVLYYKVAQWCKFQSIPVLIIPDDEVGNMIRDAMETQNKIGWDNFIKGLICIKWKLAQYMFKEAMPTFKGYDKEVWSSKVITALWKVFCLIKNARNACLHIEMATMSSSMVDLQ
eukprot:13878302-Ditylum_brightwellii.AAC.1